MLLVVKTGNLGTQRVAKQKREFKKLKREKCPKGNLNPKREIWPLGNLAKMQRICLVYLIKATLISQRLL